MRRIFALLATSLLFFSTALAVDLAKPENFLPGDLLMTADIQLAGKLKQIAEPFLRSALEAGKQNGTADASGTVLGEQLLAGESVTFGYADAQNFLAVFKASDAQWQTLTAGRDKEMYEGYEIFLKSPEEAAGDELDELSDALPELRRESYVRIGEFAVFATTLESAKKVVDVARGATLSSLGLDPDFRAINETLLSPRIAGMNMDFSGLLKQAGGMFGLDEKEQRANDLIGALLKRIGMSFNETAAGYGFSINIIGDGEKMKEKKLSLVPSGNFKPMLYGKLPNAAPIFYSEYFNLKLNQERSRAFSKALLGDAFADADSVIDALLQEALGLTQGELYAPFTQEFAMAIQSVPGLQLPTATVLANAAGNAAAAQKMADTLVEKFTAFLKKETPKGSYEVSRSGAMHKITLHLTKLDKEYEGPQFAPIVITAGVTSDNLFVISTHPDIENPATRTGLQQNADFASHPDLKETHASVLYFHPRNLWKWFDGLLEWAESYGDPGQAPPLHLYQDYYGMLKYLYPWKDLVVTTDGGDDRLILKGAIGIDGATHASYEALLDSFKKRDRDGDGVSDYDERYVYNTPVDAADCDKDGENDIEELRRGQNPCEDGELFSDVGEEAYYTDEVSLLYQRGAISGYKDGSFQPGRPVNRAEFVQMVIKAFEQESGGILGEINLPDNFTKTRRADEFSDVRYDDWFGEAVYQAASLGFVSGSIDPVSGNRVFRPGDPITRAEAIAILNKASKALGATGAAGDCESTPFQDVSAGDWYCGAVGNAYEHGVTKGRTENSFDPFGVLNRAEAAVMIRRVLEKDIEAQSQPAPAPLKEFTPLVPNLF